MRNSIVIITLIVSGTISIITARICATIERVAGMPKVVKLTFDKGGAFKMGAAE